MSKLLVDPLCLMLFVDETGHEDLADPNYPVFGLGGCAMVAGGVTKVIRQPWREMKARHFGGAETRLHAAGMRNVSQDQMDAVGEFFRNQRFGRFAVVMTRKTQFVTAVRPYQVMPGAIRIRWLEIAQQASVVPTEMAIIHEASKRGDKLVERYFGETEFHVDGRKLPVHHAFMPKSLQEELEVADFIVHAAGRQSHSWANGGTRFRRDFQAVFHSYPELSSFINVTHVELEMPVQRQPPS